MKNWFDIWKAVSFSDLHAKFHVLERFGLFNNERACSDPDWRDFSDFWPYRMNQYSKSTCVTKMSFRILKEILDDYLPWKFKPQSFSGSRYRPALVLGLWMKNYPHFCPWFCIRGLMGGSMRKIGNFVWLVCPPQYLLITRIVSFAVIHVYVCLSLCACPFVSHFQRKICFACMAIFSIFSLGSDNTDTHLLE